MIKVAAVDDDSTAWDLYTRVFAKVEDMALVHESKTLPGFMDHDFTDIDVVLMDGKVHEWDDGYAATADLLDQYPHLKIILSSYAPDHAMALAVGAMTSWIKGSGDLDTLPNIIRNVANAS